MLVLSRNQGESIVIQTPAGELVEVMIVECQGKKIRVGIEAPKDHIVYRKELLQKIQCQRGDSDCKR